MERNGSRHSENELEAAQWLLKAIESEQCLSCGCFHTIVLMIEDEPGLTAGGELSRALSTARELMKPPETNCRGCEPCLSMEALKEIRGME